MSSEIGIQDVIRFNTVQHNRAQQNLIRAENRGDVKAVANIRKKIAIYQYTLQVANYYQQLGVDIIHQIHESGD